MIIEENVDEEKLGVGYDLPCVCVYVCCAEEKVETSGFFFLVPSNLGIFALALLLVG